MLTEKGAREAFESICNKFRSGNDTPVERAWVTRKELDHAFRHWLSRLCLRNIDEGPDVEFQDWIKDPFTHWISDEDAAFQAWQHQQERIDMLKARITNMEEKGLF